MKSATLGVGAWQERVWKVWFQQLKIFVVQRIRIVSEFRRGFICARPGGFCSFGGQRDLSVRMVVGAALRGVLFFHEKVSSLAQVGPWKVPTRPRIILFLSLKREESAGRRRVEVVGA